MGFDNAKSSRAPSLVLLPGEGATDDALCRAFFRGDEKAFSELVRRHQGLVHALVRRYCARPEDAFDLTQKAFLKVFELARRSLGGLLASKQPIPFKAWLVRVAINLGKNHLRQARRWKAAPLELVANQPSLTLAPLEQVERAQKQAQVRKAVLELPRRQRQVLTLRVDGGLSFAEIGALLGLTETNAKAHFHLAVKRLRTLVAKEET